MTTTNLFVIANVKQLRTWVVLEFYCLFSEHLRGVGVLNSAIFNSFHKSGWVWHVFGGPSEVRGGYEHPKPPTPSVRHCQWPCVSLNCKRGEIYGMNKKGRNFHSDVKFYSCISYMLNLSYETFRLVSIKPFWSVAHRNK